MREKVGKSRNTVFFQWFGAPEGRKVGSLKRRVRSQLARWEMKKCTPLWREAHFQVKMLKNTRGSDHFWKLRCRKSARRCGAKHISKSKCTKHTIVEPLLEVAMSKKRTPLWREADFQVKMYKTHHCRTTFGSCDVEKVHAVVAQSTFPSQNVQNTPGSDHFWKLRCRKSARRCGAKHISKWKCTKHTMLGPLLEVQMSKKCTPLWREAHFEVKMCKTPGFWTTFGGSDVASLHYTTLHYTTLHSTTLRSTTLNYSTQHYKYNYTTTLHYTPLHSTTLNYTTLHYTTLHSTTLHYTPLHYTTLPSTTLHYITLHSTTLQLQLQLHNYTPLQYTPLHCTTLNYTTLHYITLHYTPLHYITLHYLPVHFTTLHYTTLHYTTTTTTTTTTQLHPTTLHYTKLHYTTLHYTTLHYIPLHSTTLHYITLHYITLNDIAPQIDK